MSIFDTMLTSTLTECQDDPTHNLSLAINGETLVSGIVSGVNTNKGKAEVIPYELAQRWNIGLETAKRTILKTTQRALRSSPQTLCCLNGIVQMIEYSGTGGYLLICLLTLFSRHTGEISMPKFIPTGTHGARHIQWQGKVKHMRHYHSCLCNRGSQALW